MASFIKRGDRWRALIDRRGVRRGASFSTKRQAQAWAARIEAEIDANFAAGRTHRSTDDTIATLIDRYVREVKPRRRWGKSKDDSLRKLRDGLGDVRVTDMTAERIIAHARKRHAQGAGPVTVSAEVSYLGRMLRIARAVWRIDVPRDIVTEARDGLTLLGLVGKSKRRDRVASDDELQLVRDAWASEVPVEVIDFAVLTTMRLSEITSLLCADLNDRTVIVRDRKHPTEKLGNDQTVPLLGGAWEIALRQCKAGGRIWPFPSDTVGTAFRRAVQRSGVRDLRFHDLRHTGITRLFNKGLSIPQVALISGHRDWASLRRYTHVSARDLLDR